MPPGTRITPPWPVGPPGPPGPEGPEGPEGPQGPQGPAGVDGVDGTDIADIPVASPTTPGLIRLSGDLGGDANVPRVTGLTAKANDSTVVHNTGNETIAGIKTYSSSPIVPTPSTSTQAANKGYVDGVAAAGGIPDADATTKGAVRLTNHLGGTALNPTVPGLATKADDSTVAHLAGTETFTGAKTHTLPPTVPTPTAGGHAANKTYVDGVAGAGSTPDADASGTKGKLTLAQDLGGTAALPQVIGIRGKSVSSTAVASTADRRALVYDATSNSFLPGNRQAYRVFYVEDYGAVANDSTDCTTAITNAIDAANTAGGGTVVFGPGTYRVSSAPRTDRSGNAVIALPTAGSNLIKLQGVPRSTIINCTLTGLTYDATNGPPSVLGGPTEERVAGSKSDLELHMDGFIVRAPANPTISGVDLVGVKSIRVTNVYPTSATPTTQPTSTWTFGFRAPGYLNSGRVWGDEIVSTGFYVGNITAAHSAYGFVQSRWCQVGLGLQGQGGESHITTFQNLDLGWCPFLMAGWTPAGGQTSMGATDRLTIDANLNVEDAAAGNWFTAFAHIVDFNNALHGEVRFSHGSLVSGAAAGKLNVQGAPCLNMIDLATAGPGSMVFANPVSGQTYQNTTGRDWVCALRGTLAPTSIDNSSCVLEISQDGVTWFTYAMESEGAPVENSRLFTITFPSPQGWRYRASYLNASVSGLQCVTFGGM